MFGLLLVSTSLFSAAPSRGQDDALSLKVSLGAKSVPEHLPVELDLVVHNRTDRELQIFPYDIARLPRVIASISFQSPLVATHPIPSFVATGVPDVIVKPDGSLSIRGYLQDYLRHLGPGNYSIPYDVRWKYSSVDGGGGARAGQILKASGTLVFEVTRSDSETLQHYLLERRRILELSTDAEARDRAAREIAYVDDPIVAPTLISMKNSAFESEVLDASRHLDNPAATQVLVAIASSSQDPGIVRDAIRQLQDRGQPLPDDSLRKLLNSSNKWLQIDAIEYAGTSHRQGFAAEISQLTQSQDSDVRSAAQVASQQFHR